MSLGGYPNRLTRHSFGPQLEDAAPVDHPKIQIPAGAFNAAFWQIAGLNLAAAVRASLIASWNGSDFDISHQEEAWNAKHEQTHPQLARSSAGVYTYTFASTYKNTKGEDIQLVLAAPRITTHRAITSFGSRVVSDAWIDPSAPLVVEIRIWTSAGTPTDAGFWLEVA